MNETAKRVLSTHEEIANLIEERIDHMEIGVFLRELHNELSARAETRLIQKRDDANYFEAKYHNVRNAFEPQPEIARPLR